MSEAKCWHRDPSACKCAEAAESRVVELQRAIEAILARKPRTDDEAGWEGAARDIYEIARTALSPRQPQAEADACRATPCDLIRATNAERDRVCTLARKLLSKADATRLIDAMHGAADPKPQDEAKPCCQPCPTGQCSPSAPCTC